MLAGSKFEFYATNSMLWLAATVNNISQFFDLFDSKESIGSNGYNHPLDKLYCRHGPLPRKINIPILLKIILKKKLILKKKSL